MVDTIFQYATSKSVYASTISPQENVSFFRVFNVAVLPSHSVLHSHRHPLSLCIPILRIRCSVCPMSSNRSRSSMRRLFASSSAWTPNGAVSLTTFPFSNTFSSSTPPSPAHCELPPRSSRSLPPLPSSPSGTPTVPESSSTNKATFTAGISRMVVRAVRAFSTTPTVVVFTGSG